jgi:hypothetical protein
MTTPSLTFPHPVLTPIVDKPSYATLQLLRQELHNANAHAITSTLGGGDNGYLVLIMPAAEFNARPLAAAFVHPVHPGPSPPAGALLVLRPSLNPSVNIKLISKFMSPWRRNSRSNYLPPSTTDTFPSYPTKSWDMQTLNVPPYYLIIS